ncbi:MAG: hypothetical protein DRI61_11845 [Chloroflexi bacterium]|nr:MAG: hypothetical protein DRI61_11845 [Chloroflexota bacterium]
MMFSLTVALAPPQEGAFFVRFVMIEVKSLRRVVDGGLALAVDELRVGKGEAVGVVGAPADGRDVLLDVLIGRVRPGSGQVMVAGVVPWEDRTELHRRIGVLFAEDALYERLSPRQNLLAAVLLTALFIIGIGILLSQFFESVMQANTWSTVIFFPLIIPAMFFSYPALFDKVFRIIPTYHSAKVFQLAWAGEGDWSRVIFHLGVLAGSVLVISAVNIWLIKRVHS